MTNPFKILFILMALCNTVFSQPQTNIQTIQPQEKFENIFAQKIFSDTSGTGFVIWIKNNVKAHKHEHHTEHLYIIEGEGKMRLGDNFIQIRSGDYIVIPAGTIHSVEEVLSETILKVLSIQTPEFDGTDRVFIE